MYDNAKKIRKVRTAIIAANTLDDLWALPVSRNAFMKAYEYAPLYCIDVDPAGYTGGIGHMGYFRPKAQLLWDGVLDWFMQVHAGSCGSVNCVIT